ncbi:coatomer subunit beta'-2-like [Lycium ferocissimum]|uniref:coatomer subunit beta'-2-like n=1 Tax=Lycium ferocissimum TaxID=112874 RepID=UPI002816284A|nr:coatomer subunit beta'-2-like [Lycium ferocissimum]
MPLRLEIKRKLAQRSERVKSVDLHPSEPWILASLYSGTLCIWNYQTQTMVKSFEATELPVRSAKFIPRKQWVVAGADDMFIRVYNYNTMDKVKVFEAHTDYIRCVAVHPTLPYVLSSSDDMLIKLWDWEKGWLCTQIFEGHSHYVMQVTFNPKDTNTFASASLDRTIKIWNLGSPDPNFTLDAHLKGVNCVDYFTGGDKPYLITGSDDHTAKVWDYQTKSCVQTLEGHTHNVSAVFAPAFLWSFIYLSAHLFLGLCMIFPTSVAHFLESRGMIEEALEVATDPDYRFELAIQLGKLDIAQEIAAVAQSESKWKQLGDLAMSSGRLEMAEDCLKHANDLSGLLLLYSSLGDAEGITELASFSKEHGKNNVAFLCMFLLGKVEECIQLLVDSNRIPEAAFMSRSYLPSKVPEIVSIWRKDLSKVNQKAAEALADPEEYPNLFEHWQIAHAVEARAAEERGVYPPAADYVNYADRPTTNLVEAFSNMRMDEEQLENGELDHEAAEQSADEVQEQVEDDLQQEGQEEAVVVDADSTDGAVLVNGNEAEEEWVLTPRH